VWRRRVLMEKGSSSGRCRILMVDDDEQALRLYGTLLGEEGCTVTTAATAREARGLLASIDDFSLAILDLRLPDAEGLELFRWTRARAPQLPVIILTGYGSVESAVQAVQEGAFHYLTKPPEVEQLRSLVRAALHSRTLEEENALLRRRLRGAESHGGLIGRSRPMRDVYQWIKVVARAQSAVLIQGESGTGKELAARALHGHSSRREGPFVCVNCGALPPALLESELFGHEKGAFTGAVTSRPGMFELADGGTIFLDEMGECSPDLQVRLLRVLQEKEVQRVGGTRRIGTDFRMVAATNRSLEEQIGTGRFREDLYYRINVVSFVMPPLRDRKEDVPLLSAAFLEKFASREGRVLHGIDEDAMDLLVQYDWPGNVRQLENVIERGVVVAMGDRFSRKDLPPHLQEGKRAAAAKTQVLEGDCLLADVEKVAVEATMRRHGGNKSRAARTLGISRKLLYSKMREYSL
jgi:DNA-binding NtrC family response regulator